MTPDDAYSACADTLRQYDMDRFLASLFIASDLRKHVQAIYAFDVELDRIRFLVNEPIAGEVRLQWWRDALSGQAHGDATGHPVFAALQNTLETCNLPIEPLVTLTEAHIFDLYADPFPGLTEQEAYCGEVHSAVLHMVAQVLNKGEPPASGDASGHGGVASGLVDFARLLQPNLRRAQLFASTDDCTHAGIDAHWSAQGKTPDHDALLKLRGAWLARARTHLVDAAKAIDLLPSKMQVGYLHLSLLPLWISTIERTRSLPGEVVTVPQWRAQLRLWRCARSINKGRGLARFLSA